MLDFSGLSNRSILGRALRSLLRVVPAGARVPILQGQVRGAWWIVGAATHGCWLGSYEREKQERIATDLGPGDVFYDVGANAGFYTLLASRLIGPKGHVYAFEPLPRNLEYLNRHVSLNGATNVSVIPMAVSDRPGETGFLEGCNPSTGHADVAGTLIVSATSLDAFVYESGHLPPQVVKMDIEGGEFAALSGARRVLRESRPLIFLATHGAEVHQSCVTLLRESGYELSSLDQEDVQSTAELRARPKTAAIPESSPG